MGAADSEAIFAGRYEVRRKLGAGGMGVVYEAFDRERRQAIALKTIKRGSPGTVARFKREFRSLADVVHPNLVGLYELYAGDEEVFFTMELVRGRPFTRWVRIETDEDGRTSQAGTDELTAATRTVPLAATAQKRRIRQRVVAPGVVDPPRLRDALRQLAEGVHAIHSAGKLHRDLKPSNVLVNEHGRVVVLDFGLATELSRESLSQTEDRPLEGTAAFMSPEQGARLPLTPDSDWYSVGVILYVALTGRLPFVGHTEDILMDKQRFEPAPPREISPDVPEDLDALCVELLRRDPARRPPGRDILRRLGIDPLRAGPSWSLGTSRGAYGVVVGRERQLTELEWALGDVHRGVPVVARVSGPSGMGKSRLVRTFLDGLEGRALVLRGRCYEHETVSFKAVDGVVDELARFLSTLPQLDVEALMPRDAQTLARLFPVMRQIESITARRRRAGAVPDPQELRRRGFQALRELLARVADRQPLVVTIDDLQWGDSDSAALLATVMRPPDPPPMLLVLCHRSEDRVDSEMIAELDRQLDTSGIDIRDISVDALDEDEARELALVHLADSPRRHALARRIATEAQGNPFFVEELARHLHESDETVDASLDAALRSRVLRIPPPADRLLGVVAVAGRPLPQELALRAANTTDPSALALLKAGSFVRTRGAGDVRFVEPYHDRIRHTAVALLSDDDRQRHHARLARVYEASPHPDAELLAMHLAEAGEPTRAAEYAEQAGHRAAQTLAFDRAARNYRLAIALDPQRETHALLAALGDALSNAGRGGEAAAAYLAAAEDAPSGEALDLRCRASGQLLYSGHIDQGLEQLHDISRAMGIKVAPTERRALLSLLRSRLRLRLRGLGFKEREEREIAANELTRVDVAFAVAEGLGMTDTIRGADFQGRHLLLALRAGEPRRIARALAAEAVFRSLRGVKGMPRAHAVLEQLGELAARLDEPALHGIHIGAAGMVDFNDGRWQECYDKCVRAEEIFRNHCVGYRWELATTHMFQCFVLTIVGHVRAMVAHYPALVEEAYERGDLYQAISLRVCLGFYLPLTRDDPAGAHRELDEAIRQWSARGFHLQHANALHAHIVVDLYAGDGRSAHQRALAEWRPLERSHFLRGQIARVLLVSARARAALAAVRDGGERSLVREAKKLTRKLEREGASYTPPITDSLRATIARLEGDDESAAELLERAEIAFMNEGLQLWAESVRRARGLTVGGDEGAALVARADSYFTDEGLSKPEQVAEMFAAQQVSRRC